MNTKPARSQTEKVLDALQRGEPLTALRALRRFGCLRLGARIHELRQAGYPIGSRMVPTKTGKHVSEYFMLP